MIGRPGLDEETSRQYSGGGELDNEEIHSILSNQRRRLTLEYLRRDGGQMSVRELSERIAAAETDKRPPPRNKRQSVYVSLHQTHLPKLDDLGIVTYDAQGKTVRLEPPVSEVAVYMETVPRFGLSWSEFYAGMGILGTLTVVGAVIGTPVLSGIGPAPIAILHLGLVTLAGIYQTHQQESSILHRLRGSGINDEGSISR